MHHRRLLVLGFLLLMPEPLLAQEWTAAQQEVWAAIEHCWDLWDHQHDAEAFQRECWHDRATFWISSEAAPFRKEWPARVAPRFFFNHVVDEEYRLWPLSIEIFGDAVVVNYIAHYITMLDDGTQERSGQKRTETLVRVNDRWVTVGVHATILDG